VEILLDRPLGPEVRSGGRFARTWSCLLNCSRKLKPGDRVDLPGGGVAVARPAGTPEDGPAIDLDLPDPGAEYLERHGEVPLPAYIRRSPDDPRACADRERYQTVFAREDGAVAAPTAGLHFTPDLLARVRESGVEVAAVTLHVGPGTFLPVRSEDLRQHRLHPERYRISAQAAGAFADCRRRGGRVVAVGTTVVRALESACRGEALEPGEGGTRLFITPGYAFRAVDALLTNFHLPRSTLLMLVCAFAGRERVLAAYAEAVREGYRFYSYGDAMFLD
jgi:S-adenosylmethionine:tRNA ribosyltransferase-isomerase